MDSRINLKLGGNDCTEPAQMTIYTSYDVFSPKDVPFGGLIRTAPHFGGKIPPKPLF